MARNSSALDLSDLTLDLVIPALEAAGLEPIPEQGATDAQIEAWVEQFIDASVKTPVQPPVTEIDHGR